VGYAGFGILVFSYLTAFGLVSHTSARNFVSGLPVRAGMVSVSLFAEKVVAGYRFPGYNHHYINGYMYESV
jgi:hypothetical protein